ncbi:cleft lip and palate transmembrane protein 1-domain-containing protein [Pterulicium gracile]|uniref:Cleft lip and palate transmembrane protein 1-domain-containing protein n=1 Tax=Pterulicium gracile TaxID=1884261 RepID=A0A5C3QV13_9AGAR|nr:cleft lip and palate transmembrane protein 1-domain-containing protein [Pterula gracilis]
MHVYFSTSRTGGISFGRGQDAGLPQFVWENITFGDWSESRTEHFEVDFPKSVQNNGTLWADIYLVKNSSHPDPKNSAFHPENVHHIRKNLTPYLPKDKIRKERSLLSSAEEEAEGEQTDDVSVPDIIVPHWHTNLTLALISDAPVIPYAQTPPPMLAHIHLVPGKRDETGTKGYYNPIIFSNEFWQLRSHMIEVNTTTPTLPITINFQPMSFMKFQLFATMTHGFNEAAKNQGGGTAEFDEIKRMLLETNPWFLGLTALVSVLHMIFEMLAFKNDVTHWKEKKEMVGVSIITNVFVQVIILLYLIDNNTDTSWMIIFGSGMGAAIEAWKITKAVDISVKPAAPGAVIPYRLDIKDKHVLSEDEIKTQEYEFDKLAFRYVGYATVPLLAGYTVYSLLYETHRGWYSFVISTLTSFVYMFGFAQLVPQLIINYKLKSVSHMPMKSMIYKSLSTVVDDLFAFCIKMPWLHRLSCFRDDIVFCIFLYQATVDLPYRS